MSNTHEVERQERERLWQARREAGGVNTFAPHSGVIDPRTIPGFMDKLDRTHPLAAVAQRLVDSMIEKHGGGA